MILRVRGRINRPNSFLGLEDPLAIAHRGGAAEHPENTMAAFEHAVKLGYRCIETDVRATGDRVAVVFHDEHLDRLTDHTGPLAARDWARLDEVRIDGKEPIVRLDDLLGTWPELRLIRRFSEAYRFRSSMLRSFALPTHGACPCKSGRWTTVRRWSTCSTSAQTAS